MALKPQPIEFPQPVVVRGGQLVTHTLPVPAATWATGITWVQYPESAPLTAAFDCSTTGFGTVSGATVGSGTAQDFTDAATEGYTFTQKPFSIYRALRNTTLGEVSMIGDEQLLRANGLMLERWISIAIAQELITGAASGGYGLEDAAARVSGVEGVYGLSAAMDEYTKRAGCVRGYVHLPSSIGGIPTGSWMDGVWGDGIWGEFPDASSPTSADATTARFTPIVDAGYQLKFMRNRVGVGSGSVAGFITGQVYLSVTGSMPIVTNEDMLTGNVIEALDQVQAILVFNPLTVVSFAAETVADYSVTASPLA